MKKLCILAVLIAAMSMSGFSGVVMAENSVLIENGDFENGISGFGICYSGKEDTVMPSLRESKLLSKEGGALEFVPGANLSSAASNSPASLGFAYQGVFNKSLLDLKQGVKYSVSADIYPAVNDIKMRFVLVSNNRAVAASDEFDVPADKWNSLTFSYVPEEDIENAKVRIAFYNIKYEKSVYVDNLSCSEAIVSNSMWEAVSDEDITIEDGALSFTTAEGTESGIEAVTDSGKYINGETYGLTATVSTTAQVKAVLTEEVMDNLGVSVIPAFKTADKDDVYAYLSDKTISDGEELVDEIKLASALSSLNDKKQTLTHTKNADGTGNSSAV